MANTAQMDAQQLAQFRQQQASVNNQFLGYSLVKPVAGSTLNGTSISSTTNSLKFQVSGINGAWLRRVRVTTYGSFTYTPAATSPTISINAVGLDGIYAGVKQTYGSSYKPTIRPIFFRLMDMLRGYGRLPYNVEPSVSDDISVIQPVIGSTLTDYKPGGTLTSGANSFQHTFDIPMQAIHPSHPSGMLPIDTTGTVYTLELVPNNTGLVGSDALDNVFNTNGTVTMSATVNVTFFYSDGESLTYTQFLQPNMSAMPSAEYAEVTDTNLYANQLIVQQLQLALPIARIATIVVDGVSSSQFAQVGTPSSPDVGVTQYALLKGSNVNNSFISYDSTNGGVANYYQNFRRHYGIDLPAGVFVYDAIGANVVNPSNQAGLAFWDTSSGVWAASRVGVQVANVGSNGTPRLVTTTVVQNPAGIIK